MTIQDKIISFETAKLAAKLGFNLYVIGTHHYNYYDENGEGGVIGWGHLNSKNAPMSPQGLLQKWLREEHKIIVLVGHLGDSILDDPKMYFYSFPCYPREIEEDDYYESYEEALEVGLFKALNKIKK